MRLRMVPDRLDRPDHPDRPDPPDLSDRLGKRERKDRAPHTSETVYGCVTERFSQTMLSQLTGRSVPSNSFA